MLYFIVNEESRSGKSAAVWHEIQLELQKRNVTYKAWLTEYAGHATVLAKHICELEDEDKNLVVVGGDGTANEVINGMKNFDRVRFGMIPLGSGNDLARGLGLTGTPTEMLDKILDCMEQGKEQAWEMDLGRVSWNEGQDSRLFAISSGVGLDALVCKKTIDSKLKKVLNKIGLGKLTYIFLTVESLFTMKTAEAAVHFDKHGQQNRKKAICFAVMNFRAEGGGVPMAPKADAEDGKLSVCSIFGIPKWRTFLCLPFLVLAKHTWLPGFEITDCRSGHIHLNEPMVLHTDGEYCGDVDDVQFTCLPKKLRVLR